MCKCETYALEIPVEDIDLVIEVLRSRSMYYLVRSEEGIEDLQISDKVRVAWRENSVKLDKLRFELQQYRAKHKK